jgi:hypothetical protein
MGTAFLWDDKVAAASVTALTGTTIAGMPLSNLADPQPRLRARLLGSAVSLLVDFGAAVAIGAVAAISTTLSESATARLRIGPAESFFEAVPLFDLRFDAGPIAPPSGYNFSRASTATYIDAAGVLRTAAANTLRIDHDPATHECLGALLEESRTNMVRYSGDVANSAWVKFGAPSVTANAGIAPDGTMTATALVLTPSSGFYQSVTAAGGETWIGSIWLRAEAPGTFRQAATGSPSGPVTRLIAVTTEWQRFSLGVTLAAGADHFGLQIDGTGGGGTIYAWGAQSEKAAEASSTIPTTSAAATRAADRQWLAGQAIDGSAGLSAVVDFTKTSTAGTAVPLAFSTASTAFGDTWYVQAAPGGGMTLILNDSAHGDYPLPAPYAPYGPGNVQRIAFGTGARGGVTFASDANAPNLRPPVPIAAGSFTTVGLGGGAWGGAPGTVAGLLRIRRIAVYGAELTPGQVAALAGTGSTIDAVAMALDSGTIAAEVSDDSGGNLVLVLPAPASGRYLRLDLEASGAVVIDIGRIVAGPLWRPSRSYAYGIVEGRQINDRVDINPLTGARFPVPALVNPRFAKFTLPLLTTAEVRGEFRALTKALGGVGDLLWIPETASSQAELNNRSLWGAAAAPGDLAGASRDSFVGSQHGLQIIERV